MTATTILTGREAEASLNKILEGHEELEGGCDYPAPYLSGYFQNKGSSHAWTAFDNTTGDCWCEDFPTKAEAKEYANNI